MRKGLAHSNPLPINCDTHELDTNPLKIRHCRVFELSVAVRAQDEEVAWVVANLRIKMVYFKVRFAVPFLESERAKLALSVMQFSK